MDSQELDALRGKIARNGVGIEEDVKKCNADITLLQEECPHVEVVELPYTPEVGFSLEFSARRICTFCGKIEREQSPNSGIYEVLSHNPTHFVEREGFYLLLNSTIQPVSKK